MVGTRDGAEYVNITVIQKYTSINYKERMHC